MLPHSLTLKLARPGDHLVSRARSVLFGGGLSQDSRADEQVYRIGERQRRLLRVALVAQFDAKRGSQQAGVPVATDRVALGFPAEVCGAFQAVDRHWEGGDGGHGSALSESVVDGDSQPFGFRGAVGDAAQHFKGKDQAGDQALFVGALARFVRGADPRLVTFAHPAISKVSCCGKYVPEVAQ